MHNFRWHTLYSWLNSASLVICGTFFFLEKGEIWEPTHKKLKSRILTLENIPPFLKWIVPVELSWYFQHWRGREFSKAYSPRIQVFLKLNRNTLFYHKGVGGARGVKNVINIFCPRLKKIFMRKGWVIIRSVVVSKNKSS